MRLIVSVYFYVRERERLLMRLIVSVYFYVRERDY